MQPIQVNFFTANKHSTIECFFNQNNKTLLKGKSF